MLAALAVLGGLWGTGMVAKARADAPAPVAAPVHTLEEIVVTAQRDEALRRQVESALHDNPYVNDAHISVSIRHGVVTLSGLVLDEWDLRAAKRLARHVSGVTRVIDNLEIEQGGE